MWLAVLSTDTIGQSINRCGVAWEFPGYGMVSFSVSTRFPFGFPYRFQRPWTVLWSKKHLQDVVRVGAWNSQIPPPYQDSWMTCTKLILVYVTWSPLPIVTCVGHDWARTLLIVWVDVRHTRLPEIYPRWSHRIIGFGRSGHGRGFTLIMLATKTPCILSQGCH